MSSDSTILLRRATASHTDEVLECLRAAFSPFESSYTPAAYEDTVLTRESFLQRLKQMTVFVAVDGGGHIVGTIACSVADGAEGHLRGMAVRPEWQARGIADRLLQRAEAELFEQKCRRITLDTTEPLQRAMRFYERNGYRRTGKVLDFFRMRLIEYAKVVGP